NRVPCASGDHRNLAAHSWDGHPIQVPAQLGGCAVYPMRPNARRGTVTAVPDGLTRARAALARQEWDACLAEVQDLHLDDPREDAERLDALAEAAWWLG